MIYMFHLPGNMDIITCYVYISHTYRQDTHEIPTLILKCILYAPMYINPLHILLQL